MGMAYTVMAYIFTASIAFGLYSQGPCNLAHIVKAHIVMARPLPRSAERASAFVRACVRACVPAGRPHGVARSLASGRDGMRAPDSGLRPSIVMAHTVMAHVLMACVATAYVVMARGRGATRAEHGGPEACRACKKNPR